MRVSTAGRWQAFSRNSAPGGPVGPAGPSSPRRNASRSGPLARSHVLLFLKPIRLLGVAAVVRSRDGCAALFSGRGPFLAEAQCSPSLRSSSCPQVQLGIRSARVRGRLSKANPSPEGRDVRDIRSFPDPARIAPAHDGGLSLRSYSVETSATIPNANRVAATRDQNVTEISLGM